MLLKSADSKEAQIAELERLLTIAPQDQKKKIEWELKTLRSGIKGEEEAAYHVNFYYEKNQNYVVLHDLRLALGDRVAQIDHLLINRWLNCIVLESKRFHSGIKITDEGEFLYWNDYKKTYEGMPSPLQQNQRHVEVLKDAFSEIQMPSRLGVRLKPDFISYVLVSNNARVIRPKKFDSSHVIKADAVKQTLAAHFDKESVLDTLGSVARMVDQGTLYAIGRRLASMHQPPAMPDYAKRFGIKMEVSAGVPKSSTRELPNSAPSEAPQSSPRAVETTTQQKTQAASEGGPKCKNCAGGGSILYGQYGYYLKCDACGANTSVKVDCGVAGHKERVRKEGKNFFRECAACGTSSLYYVNP